MCVCLRLGKKGDAEVAILRRSKMLPQPNVELPMQAHVMKTQLFLGTGPERHRGSKIRNTEYESGMGWLVCGVGIVGLEVMVLRVGPDCGWFTRNMLPTESNMGFT